MPKKQLLTLSQKLAAQDVRAAFSSDAIGTGDISYYVLELSAQAAATASIFAEKALLFNQYDNYISKLIETNDPGQARAVGLPTIPFQELAEGLSNMAKGYQGIFIRYTTVATPEDAPLYEIASDITVGSAKALAPGLTYPTKWKDTDKLFDLTVFIVPGPKGETGAPGQDGQAGAPGKPGQDSAIGSNPDGSFGDNDQMVFLPTCLTVLDVPYGSGPFTYSDHDILPAIQAAAAASGRLATGDTIASAQLDFTGLTYGGVVTQVDLGILTIKPSNQPKKLTVKDSGGKTRQIYYDVESLSGSGNVFDPDANSTLTVALNSQMWHYSDEGVNVRTNGPVLLNGEFADTIFGAANKHNPATENDESWLKINLCSFVKTTVPSCVRNLPYSIDFRPLSAVPPCWTAELYQAAWHGLQFEGRPGFGGYGNAVTSPYFAASARTVHFTLPATGTTSGDIVTVQAVSQDGQTILSTVDVPFDNSGEITYTAAVDGSAAPSGYFYVRMLSTGKILLDFSIS